MSVNYRRPSEGFDSFMERLNEFCGDPDLSYAEETLGGIWDWCDKSGVVTDNQETAVTNIVGEERMEE